jgi:hypothetical protein
VPPAWLIELEHSLAADPDGEALATAVVVLAAMAGREIAIAEAERRGATRRALVLLAAGGDPERGLDLKGRAVTALADDLRDTDRQLALEAGIRDLSLQAAGLPHVSEAVHALADAPDVAWRAYACSLLAEELDAGE